MAESRDSTVGQIVSGVVSVAFIGLTFWGIFWSFHRHSTTDGLISIFAPPYAWYRGVAYLWEEPKWKEDWDVRTEQIAALLNLANRDKKDTATEAAIPELVSRLRNWLKKVPDNERLMLKSAVQAYIDATVECMSEIFRAVGSGHVDAKPCETTAVSRYVDRFQHVTGLRSAWTQTTADAQIAGEAATRSLTRPDGPVGLNEELVSKLKAFSDTVIPIVRGRCDAMLKRLFDE